MRDFKNDESFRSSHGIPSPWLALQRLARLIQPIQLHRSGCVRKLLYHSSEDVNSTGNNEQIGRIRRAIIDFYSLPDTPTDRAAPVYASFQRLVHLLSDMQHIIPALWEARLKTQHGWPAYSFHFTHAAGLLGPYTYQAVVHGDEAQITLAGDVDEGSSVTRSVRATMLGAYVSFVKTGEPGPKWPRLEFGGTTGCAGAVEGYRAARITAAGVCTEGAGGEGGCGEEGWQLSVASRLAFWDHLAGQYDLRRVRSFPDTQGQCLPPRK